MFLRLLVIVLICALPLLAGCGGDVDWRARAKAEAESVRREKAAAKRLPDFDINWVERAEKNRVLAAREHKVREKERSVWEAKLKEEARQRSIQEMHEAALREQAEWLASNKNRKDNNLSKAIQIARSEGKIEWLQGTLSELEAKDMLLPEVVEIRREEAERIVADTVASLDKDPVEQRKQRVFNFFDRMGMSKAEREKQDAERLEMAKEAREHGLGQIAQIDADTDLSDLRYVCLSGPEISDESLARLAGNESVKLLHIDRTSVSPSGLLDLKSLPNLRMLVIEHTLLPDELVAELRRKLPNVAVHYLPPVTKPPVAESPKEKTATDKKPSKKQVKSPSKNRSKPRATAAKSKSDS